MLKRKAAAKKPTKSTTKPVNPKGNKSHGSSNKALPKKTRKGQKRVASDGSDDESSSDSDEEEPRPRKKAKKTAPEEVEEEEDARIEEISEQSDLEERHHAGIPDILTVKKDSTKDMLTIFSERVDVKFKKGEKNETITGRWCLLCR